MYALGYERMAERLSRLFPFSRPAMMLQDRLAPLLASAGVFASPRVYARFSLALLLYPLPLDLLALSLGLPRGPMLLGALLLLQSFPFVLLLARRQSRRRAAEAELPFLLMALTVLSGEGSPSLEEGMGRVAALGASVLPAFREEDSVLERNLAFSSRRPAAVLEETFSSHPSAMLREFVYGFLTTLASGKDAWEYLEQEARRRLELLQGVWRGFAESVGSLAEVSFLLLAVFPVGLEMIAAAIPGFASSEMLMASLLLLAAVCVFLLAMMDSAQPRLHDRPASSLHLSAAVLSWLASAVLFYGGEVGAAVSLLVPLLVSSASFPSLWRHRSRLRRGEEESALLLHDLAEAAKAGVDLPEALSRSAAAARYPSIRRELSLFHHSVMMGAVPAEAQKELRGRSWLVRLAFGMLAMALDAGAGFGQLESLSSFFKRVSDARRSAARSLLPFVAMGVVVPAISAFSLVLLSGFAQSGASFLPDFSQLSRSHVLLCISAVSMMTGLLLSKLSTQSVRCILPLPPILLSTLLSLLVLGLA